MPIRVYADTSVYGGAFGPEFSGASLRFFEQVREQRFELVVSPLVRDELQEAPAEVWSLLEGLLPIARVVEPATDAVRLRAE